MTDFKELREALEAVAPCGDWHKSGSTVDIEESDEWAPVRVEVRANKLINRKVAAYVCAAKPATIRSLLKELDEARRDAASKQARIDALMLEYCPDEMTEEQITAWSVAQVGLKPSAAIDAMKEQQP